jgi:hypothetical protein
MLFIMELGYEVDNHSPLHGDNKGTIDLVLSSLNACLSILRGIWRLTRVLPECQLYIMGAYCLLALVHKVH